MTRLKHSTKQVDTTPPSKLDNSSQLTPTTSIAVIESMDAFNKLSNIGYLSISADSGISTAHPISDTLKTKNQTVSKQSFSTDEYPSKEDSLIKASKSLDRYRNFTEDSRNIELGIQYQQQNRLRDAFKIYLKEARKDIPLALFLCGLSLRHGWGCKPDQLLALSCFEHSADKCSELINEISGRKKELEAKEFGKAEILRHEMGMSLFEIGNSYRFGWGVTVNLKVAAFYYKLAADNQDLDGLMALGRCYWKGEGVAVDKFLSACYYRIAVIYGRWEFSNSWIYKEKYTKFFREKFPHWSVAEVNALQKQGKLELLTYETEKKRGFFWRLFSK